MRKYGQWSGNPKGTLEDIKRCIVLISDNYSWVRHQCSRKRGHGKDGLYCKQHSTMSHLWVPEDKGEKK